MGRGPARRHGRRRRRGGCRARLGEDGPQPSGPREPCRDGILHGVPGRPRAWGGAAAGRVGAHVGTRTGLCRNAVQRRGGDERGGGGSLAGPRLPDHRHGPRGLRLDAPTAGWACTSCTGTSDVGVPVPAEGGRRERRLQGVADLARGRGCRAPRVAGRRTSRRGRGRSGRRRWGGHRRCGPGLGMGRRGGRRARPDGRAGERDARRPRHDRPGRDGRRVRARATAGCRAGAPHGIEPWSRGGDPRGPRPRGRRDHRRGRRVRQHRRRRGHAVRPRRPAARRWTASTSPTAGRPWPGWRTSTSPGSTLAWPRPGSSWPPTSTARCSGRPAPQRCSRRRRAPPPPRSPSSRQP